jgi:mRNA interferase MazF
MSIFYTQGDIVLVPFPFTDNTSTKRRPAIIISNSTVNVTPDVTLLMLTTSMVEEAFSVVISDKDLNKPLDSFKTVSAHCKKIAVLEKSLIIKKISSFKKGTKFEEILNKVYSTISLEVIK